MLKMLDGNMFRVSGTVVGESGENDVDVEVSGSDVVPDGTYSVDSKKGEAVKAILHKDTLKSQNIGKSKPVSDDVFVDIADLKSKSSEKKTKRSFRVSKDIAKRGGIEKPVDAQLTNPDENGTLQVVRVKPGAVVKDPVTGEDVSLSTAEDASKYVANGGALSEVPDEFLMTAIVENFTRKGDPVERRFKALKKGKGINGMMMFTDTHTGAKLGYKYLGGISTWWESAGFNMQFANRNSSDPLPQYDYFKEALNELFSERISELIGNEPMPMRIVDSRGGADAGVSLVSELAHNRWETVVSPFSEDVLDEDDRVQDVDKSSYARMRLLDLIIGNTDRNEGNYALAHRENGSVEIVPIDNSLAFLPEEAGDRLSPQDIPFNLTAIDEEIAQSPEDWEEFVDIVGDLQRVLAAADLNQLSAFFENAIKLISELRPGLLSPELIESERINMLKTAIERIVTALEMDPEDLARELVTSKRSKRGRLA